MLNYFLLLLTSMPGCNCGECAAYAQARRKTKADGAPPDENNLENKGHARNTRAVENAHTTVSRAQAARARLCELYIK